LLQQQPPRLYTYQDCNGEGALMSCSWVRTWAWCRGTACRAAARRAAPATAAAAATAATATAAAPRWTERSRQRCCCRWSRRGRAAAAGAGAAAREWQRGAAQ